MNHPLTEKIINEALNEFPTVGFHPDKFLRGLTIEAIKYAIKRTANEFRVEEKIPDYPDGVGEVCNCDSYDQCLKCYIDSPIDAHNQLARQQNAKVDEFNPKNDATK